MVASSISAFGSLSVRKGHNVKSAVASYCGIALLLVQFSGSSGLAEEVESRLVGSWKLVSWTKTDIQGLVTYPFGRGVNGGLRFSDLGRMSMYVSDAKAVRPVDTPGVNPNVGLARLAPPFFARQGTYTFDEGAMTVSYHLETTVSKERGWSRTWQVEFQGREGLLLTSVIDDDTTVGVRLAGTNMVRWVRHRQTATPQ